MTTNAAFLSANSWLGLIKEATRGTTPSSGTVEYIPVTDPQISPMQTFLRDEALRGSPVAVYNQIQSVRHDEVDFKCYVYADTFPALLMGVLGGTDTVTGTGPYTHAIKLLNSASTGSQPPSYSICDFDGANYFLTAGAQAVSLDLAGGAEKAAEATVKYSANPYADSTSAPTPFTSQSWSGEALIPNWDTTVSVNSTSLDYIAEFTLKIDRKTAPIFTMGTKAPYLNFAGPIDVSGSFTAVVASNADPFSISTSTGYALAYDAVPVVITMTDPNDVTSATNHSVAFTMSAVQFQNVKRSVGKEYTELTVDFTANADSTDASTGYSPIATSTINGVSAAY